MGELQLSPAEDWVDLPFQLSIGSTLKEVAHQTKISLRGNPDDKGFQDLIERTFGPDFPTEINHWSHTELGDVLKLGPDEWIILTDEDGVILSERLESVFSGLHVSIVDLSDYYRVFRLSGAKACNALARGCPFDTHKSRFSKGQCTRTKFAKAEIILRALDEDTVFDVMVRRSAAPYLWNYLCGK